MMNKENITVLVIGLDNLKFAFPVKMVDSIIMAQEVTPGDNTKSFICGIINLRGEIIPVISLRRRFSLPDRDILSENFFTILAFKHLKIAIIADMIFGVESVEKGSIRTYKEIMPGMSELEFYSDSDGIYYIYNTENLLSQAEEEEVRKMIVEDVK